MAKAVTLASQSSSIVFFSFRDDVSILMRWIKFDDSNLIGCIGLQAINVPCRSAVRHFIWTDSNAQ